jgi:predicted nucleotidyltransferase
MKSKELIGFVSPKELYVKNVEVLRDRIERRKEMCGGEDDAGSLELRKFLPKKSSTEDEREDERR